MYSSPLEALMSSRRITPVIALGATALLALAGCSGGNSATGGGQSGSDSLVIDTAFSIETTDPGHTYDPTGNMIAKALYETLVDFEGSDVSTPVPGLASWEQNDEATEFTFTLDGDRVFSDGSPIEAKDVVFSLQRIQGMEDAKPNFLLGGLTITEVDDKINAEAQRRREEALRASVVASDAERRRLAGTLHDGPVQELTAASLTVV